MNEDDWDIHYLPDGTELWLGPVRTIKCTPMDPATIDALNYVSRHRQPAGDDTDPRQEGSLD